jgi:hypothetical protein
VDRLGYLFGLLFAFAVGGFVGGIVDLLGASKGTQLAFCLAYISHALTLAWFNRRRESHLERPHAPFVISLLPVCNWAYSAVLLLQSDETRPTRIHFD